MTDRIVVVGLGAVTCLGRDLQQTWEGLIAGRSGLKRHTETLDPSLYLQEIAGLVEGFGPGTGEEEPDVQRLAAKFIHLGLKAAREAWRDAGLESSEIDRDRVAVSVGSGLGGLDLLRVESQRMAARSGKSTSPYLVPGLIANQVGGQISQQLGLYGPSLTPVNACATGGHAIASAASMLRAGEADFAVCGASESGFTPEIVNGFVTMRAMLARKPSDRSAEDPAAASRPFSVDRAGFIMSEGAAILVLATERAAERLGLRPRASLLGWATNSDGYHVAQPHPERVAKCIGLAVGRSGLHPEQISYYNAHGTSTTVNDRVETEAVKSVFGAHARRLPVSSIKGALGHALGAASAIEAAVCVHAVDQGVIPPTIQYQADPELDLDYVPNEARPARLDAVVSASFGFGGTNNALVFGRVTDG